ncbi:MAG: hypothetical protein WC537_01660 [Candidatus Paceibacterota bacterium]|jgi:hypothetical protein
MAEKKNRRHHTFCPYQPGKRVNMEQGDDGRWRLVGCTSLSPEFVPDPKQTNCLRLRQEGKCPFIDKGDIVKPASKPVLG